MSHVAAPRWAQLARGKVGAGEARRMRVHADTCASCARARDRVSGAVDAFGEIARTPADLGLSHRDLHFARSKAVFQLKVNCARQLGRSAPI